MVQSLYKTHPQLGCPDWMVNYLQWS